VLDHRHRAAVHGENAPVEREREAVSPCFHVRLLERPEPTEQVAPCGWRGGADGHELGLGENMSADQRDVAPGERLDVDAAVGVAHHDAGHQPVGV